MVSECKVVVEWVVWRVLEWVGAEVGWCVYSTSVSWWW